LNKKGSKISDIAVDFEDGLQLATLLGAISNKTVPGKLEKNPKMRIQKVGNIGFSLDFLKNEAKVKLVGIGAEDIVDHKLKLILGRERGRRRR
jgi:hypothetical protein